MIWETNGEEKKKVFASVSDIQTIQIGQDRGKH